MLAGAATRRQHGGATQRQHGGAHFGTRWRRHTRGGGQAGAWLVYSTVRGRATWAIKAEAGKKKKTVAIARRAGRRAAPLRAITANRGRGGGHGAGVRAPLQRAGAANLQALRESATQDTAPPRARARAAALQIARGPGARRDTPVGRSPNRRRHAPPPPPPPLIPAPARARDQTLAPTLARAAPRRGRRDSPCTRACTRVQARDAPAPAHTSAHSPAHTHLHPHLHTPGAHVPARTAATRDRAQSPPRPPPPPQAPQTY